MNITLEDQIEYMRADYEWYFRSGALEPRPKFNAGACKAILATLEEVRKEESKPSTGWRDE